jgi:hypothetical protein
LTRAGNKDKRSDIIAGFVNVTKKRPALRKLNLFTSISSIDFDEDIEFSRNLNNENNNFMRSIFSIIEIEYQRRIKISISAAKSGIKFIIYRRLTSVIPEI